MSETDGIMKTEKEAPLDPDELVANAVGAMLVADGFFFAAILLSVMDSSVRSFLWLLLLIPALALYGKGVVDILHSRRLRRRLKQNDPTKELQ